MQHCRQLVIGATFYGCGRAAVSPGSVVFEGANHAGSDAVFTFNPGTDWDVPPIHPWAVSFRERLISAKVLREDRLQVGGLAPVFAEWCLEHELDVRLLSQVVERAGNVVTVLSPAGRETFSAETVIDARPRRGRRKMTTALLKHPAQVVDPMHFGAFEVVPGPFEDESYLLMETAPDTGWQEAREQLHSFWRSRPAELASWQLVLIGARFDWGQFANPVAALDAGLREVAS